MNGDQGEIQEEYDVHMVELVHAPITAEEVKKETERDPTLSRVWQFILEGWPDDIETDLEFQPYQSKMSELSVEEGCILWGGRVVIPPKLRQKVLDDLHTSHVGVVRMKLLARSYIWWPHMDRHVEEKSASCDKCVENSKNPPSALLHPWERASRPWSRIHIDHAGPVMGQTFLIIVDSFTKWVDVYPVSSTSSQVTIEKLRQSFATMGLPDVIVSDNASGFSSEEFDEFMRKNGIRHTTSAPYHPATNGAAERTVQMFKNALKKNNSKGSINTQVSQMLFTFRNTPSTVTHISPAEMMFKHKPRIRLSRVKPDPSASWRRNAERMVESKPCGKVREFQCGDRVIARSYRDGEKWVAGVVQEKTGPLSYKVHINGGCIRRHIDQMRRDDRKAVNQREVAASFEFGTRAGGQTEREVLTDNSAGVEEAQQASQEEVAPIDTSPVAARPVVDSRRSTPVASPVQSSGAATREGQAVDQARERVNPQRMRKPPKYLEQYSR